MSKFFIPSLELMQKLIKENDYFKVNKFMTSYGESYWLAPEHDNKNKKAIVAGKNYGPIDKANVAGEFGVRKVSVDKKHIVRPCTHYSSIKDKCTNVRSINGVTEVDYGEFIGCKETNKERIELLNNLFTYDNLLYTDKYYHFFNHAEVYYANQKYVYDRPYRAFAVPSQWYKIEPITWIVDEKNDIAIAKNPIIFPLGMAAALRYLNNTFEEDITPSNFKTYKDPISLDFDASYIFQYKNQVGEWIYVLATDVHNNKYKNHTSTKLIALRKALSTLSNYEEIIQPLINKLEYYVYKYNGNDNRLFVKKSFVSALFLEIENYITNFIDGLSKSIRDKEIANRLIGINNGIYEEPKKTEPKKPIGSKSEEIQKIVDEILELAKPRKDFDNIKKKIEDLIADYKERISRPVSKGLSLDNVDKDQEYSMLHHELSIILDEQRSIFQNFNKYYSMLTLIQEWKNIVNGNTDKVSDNSFSKSIATLVKVVLPYIDEEEKITQTEKEADSNQQIKTEEINDTNYLRNRLLTILNEEEEKIKEFIESENQNGYNGFDDFNYSFASRYHDVLNEISKVINKFNFINIFKETYSELINGNIKITNDHYIERYMGELEIIINYVQANGNEEEKKRLDSVLSSPINFNGDITNIFGELERRFKDIYGIKLDIEERLKTEAKSDDLNIQVVVK